jgi:hypothetical protein
LGRTKVAEHLKNSVSDWCICRPVQRTWETILSPREDEYIRPTTTTDTPTQSWGFSIFDHMETQS